MKSVLTLCLVCLLQIYKLYGDFCPTIELYYFNKVLHRTEINWQMMSLIYLNGFIAIDYARIFMKNKLIRLSKIQWSNDIELYEEKLKLNKCLKQQNHDF